MSDSIEILDLPLQLFAFGSAMGMSAALIRHGQTGEVDHWPLYVARPSVALFIIGILQTIVRGVFL